MRGAITALHGLFKKRSCGFSGKISTVARVVASEVHSGMGEAARMAGSAPIYRFWTDRFMLATQDWPGPSDTGLATRAFSTHTNDL